MAVADEFVANDEVTFADQGIETLDYGTFGKIDAAITPLRWGRFVTAVTRTVTTTVQPGDTIAIAHVEKLVTGTLRIQGKTGVGDTVIVSKPFTDKSVRNVIFKRVAKDVTRFWKNWLPVATSLVDGGTFPVPATDAIDLVKLQFFTAKGDTITVTDPANYFLRYRWLKIFNGGRKDCPELIAGEKILVRATVVSASADTDVVALRYGFGFMQRRRQHMTLVSEVKNPDNTYTREYESSWYVHFHRGFFNAGVDAITKGTLFDDTKPYSVSWWGIPYRVL
jgi:hypothetical protein